MRTAVTRTSYSMGSILPQKPGGIHSMIRAEIVRLAHKFYSLFLSVPAVVKGRYPAIQPSHREVGSETSNAQACLDAQPWLIQYPRQLSS